jgi:hypothetical protein
LFFTALLHTIDNARAEVAVDQLRFEFLDRTTYGKRLAKDIDTVSVFLDHLFHASQMPLDVAEPFDSVVSRIGFGSIVLCVIVVMICVFVDHHIFTIFA